MALSVWHFAAKYHIDVKRVYSQFGNIISDTTVHKALNSMTGSSLACLQDSVKNATKRGETEWCLVLDNVQEYCLVYEGGILCESVLKVGTAGTAIQLDDCKPGTFDLQSHLAHVAEKKQTTMTVETLRADVDWTHIHAIQSLHWVCILVDYIPELKGMSRDVSARFCLAPLAKHHMHKG